MGSHFFFWRAIRDQRQCKNRCPRVQWTLLPDGWWVGLGLQAAGLEALTVYQQCWKWWWEKSFCKCQSLFQFYSWRKANHHTFLVVKGKTWYLPLLLVCQQYRENHVTKFTHCFSFTPWERQIHFLSIDVKMCTLTTLSCSFQVGRGHSPDQQ